MKNQFLRLLLSFALLASPSLADTVILHDGASYSGQFTGPTNGEITFTDNQGIEYRFPVNDVQSIVFTPTADVISLRNGKVYSGHYTGADPLSFAGMDGVDYQFPRTDVASIVLTRKKPTSAAARSGPALVIPEGTDIIIRTDEDIDSQSSQTGQLFNATVEEDVLDASADVAIPRGTPAKLLVRDMTRGGMVHSPELALDLFSVIVKGKSYRVDTSDVDYSNKRGVGANKRTAEFGGGGAAIGALLGGIFGGGRGAGIGVGAGAGAGLLTQIFTRGKQVKVPAETHLRFRLERTLVLKPGQ
jgi:hypothetical protein